MKVYNYEQIYHQSLGKLVYRLKGSGLIVDNIFKPIKQYELDSSRIIWSNIISELNNQKKTILFRWWEYLVPQLNRFIQLVRARCSSV